MLLKQSHQLESNVEVILLTLLSGQWGGRYLVWYAGRRFRSRFRQKSCNIKLQPLILMINIHSASVETTRSTVLSTSMGHPDGVFVAKYYKLADVLIHRCGSL